MFIAAPRTTQLKTPEAWYVYSYEPNQLQRNTVGVKCLLVVDTA